MRTKDQRPERRFFSSSSAASFRSAALFLRYSDCEGSPYPALPGPAPSDLKAFTKKSTVVRWSPYLIFFRALSNSLIGLLLMLGTTGCSSEWSPRPYIEYLSLRAQGKQVRCVDLSPENQVRIPKCVAELKEWIDSQGG